MGSGHTTQASRLRTALPEGAFEIVDEVVEANRRFAGERVTFVQGDICQGGLPPADVCLVRQVLQHLPNDDILRALPHLASYRYVVVTEPLPVAMTAPNADKPLGPGIRARRGSGVVLHEPPFGWPVGTSLLRIPANRAGTQVLETTVYEPATADRPEFTWDDLEAPLAGQLPGPA